MKTHFFFDMDGTICESRQQISHDMFSALLSLRNKGNDVIIISGASKEQITFQLSGFIPSFILAQSGNDSPFWKRNFTERDRVEVLRHLKDVKKKFSQHLGSNLDDLLQDRGSQMAFSFLGHNSDIKKKKTFDPDGSLRNNILSVIPFFSNSLEVRIGGTTCFDYTHKEYTKGKNIERLIKYMDWNKENCIYFGDALWKGGNDETVIGIIETQEVKDPKDLSNNLQKYG